MSIVKLNNRGVRSVTAFGSLSSGAMTFILLNFNLLSAINYP